MNCNFPSYPVSRKEEDVKLSGKLWVDVANSAKNYIIKKEKTVYTILADPGMGKTSILNKVYNDLKNDAILLYLDLSDEEKTLTERLWKELEVNMNKVFKRCEDELEREKKELGYNLLKWFSSEFKKFLKELCIKGKKLDNLCLRIYCVKYRNDLYPRDIDGLIKILNDLTEIYPTAVLLDELKNYPPYLSDLHRIINEAKLPIILTLVPNVITQITDLALQRRLSENVAELKLSDDDKKEILRTYCPDFYEFLYDHVKNEERVSSLISKARDLIEEAIKECGDSKSCIEQKFATIKQIPTYDIGSLSHKLEETIRELLMKHVNELGLTYVHDREKKFVSGKTIDIDLGDKKQVGIDIYFEKDDKAYLMDVKLTNKGDFIPDENLDNVKKISKARTVIRDKEEKTVGGVFIITNAKYVNDSNIGVITIDYDTIQRLINKDSKAEEEFIKKIAEVLK